jgi:hypothetical protein
MSSSFHPRVSPESLIDRVYREAVSYAKLYNLPDSFVWYCVGSCWHTVGMASSQIDEWLDYCRQSYSEMRERLVHEHEKEA